MFRIISLKTNKPRLTAAAALFTAAVLLLALTAGACTPSGGGTGTVTPDSLWQKLNGYWVCTEAENQFAGFLKDGSAFNLEYGLYQTSYWIGGDITDIREEDEGSTIILSLHIPAVPANEIQEARPERTVQVTVDISTLDADGMIRIRTDELGNGGWYIYKYGGVSLQDAFSGTSSGSDGSELSWAFANLPLSSAVDILWDRLGGFWTAADEQFVGFTFKDGEPCIEFGYFMTEHGFICRLTDARPTGEYKAELTVLIPAQEANMITDARDEMQIIVYLDAGDLHVDGKIKIKIDMQRSGGWYTYMYGGPTLEAAYDNL